MKCYKDCDGKYVWKIETIKILALKNLQFAINVFSENQQRFLKP